MDEQFADRRKAAKDGWTWTKEIVGTIVGVATVMALPGGWLFHSITAIQRDNDRHEVRIQRLEEERVESAKQRDKVQEQLTKIYDLVQDVRVQQAKALSK